MFIIVIEQPTFSFQNKSVDQFFLRLLEMMFITGDKDLSHICTWFLCCPYFTSFLQLRWFLTSSKKQKARETWKCVTATTGAPEPTGIWRILITSLAILGMWFMVLGSWFWWGWSRYFYQQITLIHEWYIAFCVLMHEESEYTIILWIKFS